MKLRNLKVEGFRGFAGKSEFDLSSDATIVVGPNGLGKTSLFDAILWGLCGTLPRVGTDDRVVSLYSENGQARVLLSLMDEGKEILINRTTNGTDQSISLKVGGEEFKGASATARLTESLWPEASMAKDQNIALSSILCRTNYLQQDRLREFVESSDDQQRFSIFCELVGTGHLTDLQSALESESRSWAIASTKIAKELPPLAQRVMELESQVENLRRVATLPKNAPSISWNSWWQKEFDGEKLSGMVPDPLSPSSTSAITDRLDQLQSIRSQVARKIDSLFQVLELLKEKPEETFGELCKLEAIELEANAELRSIRDDATKLQQELAAERVSHALLEESHAQNVALAKLALQLLDEKCPVCDQNYDIINTRRRLQFIVEKPHATEPKPSAIRLEEVLNREQEVAAKWHQAVVNLRIAFEKSRKAFFWQAELDRKFKELSVAKNEQSKDSLENLIHNLKITEQSLITHCEEGELLFLEIAKVISEARLVSAEDEWRIAKDELIAHETKVKSRASTANALKALIISMRDANSKLALSRIKEIEPFVQRIYSRIDPHPSFQLISFVSSLVRGKGHLKAQLQDPIGDVSSLFPHAVLSSSQLNALALAIFLSFNLAIPRLPIDCALLDDPLQSLDDINLLGVVDLLRRVKDRRQLIVSTHDVRFGRLLARKLRPCGDNTKTSVIEFSNWTRNGPVFTQSFVDADTSGIRIVRAG
jgi:exonuclease SbcC